MDRITMQCTFTPTNDVKSTNVGNKVLIPNLQTEVGVTEGTFLNILKNATSDAPDFVIGEHNYEEFWSLNRRTMAIPQDIADMLEKIKAPAKEKKVVKKEEIVEEVAKEPAVAKKEEIVEEVAKEPAVVEETVIVAEETKEVAEEAAAAEEVKPEETPVTEEAKTEEAPAEEKKTKKKGGKKAKNADAE